jgi:hypothetical protein
LKELLLLHVCVCHLLLVWVRQRQILPF